MRRTLEGAALILRESFWKSAGSGIVIGGTIAGVGYFGVLLQIFSLGILAIGMGAAALNIGCSVFFRMLGDKIFSTLGKARPEPIIATTAGYLLAVMIGAMMLVFGNSCGTPKNLDIAMDTLFVIISSMLVAAGIIGTGALVYDTGANQVNVWTGASWAALSVGGVSPWLVSSGKTYLLSNTDNVGVGTAAPLYKLHVSGVAGEAGIILAVSTGAVDIFTVKGNGDVTAGKYYGDGSVLTSLNASSLASGSLPDGRLSGAYSSALTFGSAAGGPITFSTNVVVAASQLKVGSFGSDPAAIGAGSIYYDNVAQLLKFSNNGLTWNALAAGGASPWTSGSGNTTLVTASDNVGVGKVPVEKLDVAGNIKADYGIIAATGVFSGAVAAASFSGNGSGLAGIVQSSATGTYPLSISGNAATVVTNANLTGDVTSVGNATTLTNAPVIAKVLTGFTSGAGAVAATDSILAAIQKLDGNDSTRVLDTGDTMTGALSLTGAGSYVTTASSISAAGNIIGQSSITTSGGLFGLGATLTGGITASSGTFTASGASQYSIETSSGINIKAGPLVVAGATSTLNGNTVMVFTGAVPMMVQSSTGTLTGGSQAVIFSPAFRTGTTPTVMLTYLALGAKAPMSVSSVSATRFTANGDSVWKYSWIAIGAVP